MAIDKYGWVHCPICGHKENIKVNKDTVAKKFPFYCRICKKEIEIDIENMNMELSKPDAGRRA